MIKEITNNILQGDTSNINKVEICEAFDEIFQGLSSQITTASFLTALKTIELDCEILKGIVDSSRDSVKKTNFNCEDIFETISFNQNDKYLDVILAIDLINACYGLKVLKYAFMTPYCSNNSFLVLSEMGVEIGEYCENLKEKVEKTNFGYFLISETEKYLKYTLDVRKNLPFENILNITDRFLNPYKSKNQFIGINDTKKVDEIANLALTLGNENTIIVASSLDHPFATLEGENYVAEAWKNKIFDYNMTADLLDLPSYPIENIKVENNSNCAKILMDVFDGKTKNACYYTIVLNSALSLYISKKASSLLDGIELAKKAIDSGMVKEKIQQLISIN